MRPARGTPRHSNRSNDARTAPTPQGRLLVRIRRAMPPLFDPRVKRHALNYAFQPVLATLTLFTILLVGDVVLNAAIVVAMASTVFTIFVVPDSIASTPRRVVGGHTAGVVAGAPAGGGRGSRSRDPRLEPVVRGRDSSRRGRVVHPARDPPAEARQPALSSPVLEVSRLPGRAARERRRWFRVNRALALTGYAAVNTLPSTRTTEE